MPGRDRQWPSRAAVLLSLQLVFLAAVLAAVPLFLLILTGSWWWRPVVFVLASNALVGLAYPFRRAVGPVVAAAVLLVAWAPLAWWCAVPPAADLLLGQRPTKLVDLDRMCTGGHQFGRGADYRGPGPHPIMVVMNGGLDRVLGAEPQPHNFLPPPSVVQLVACGVQTGRAKEEPLGRCEYAEDMGTGQRHAIDVYQGRYRFVVREVSTGRTRGTFVVDGADTYECDSRATFNVDRPGPMTTDTEPGAAALETAFGAIMNATVPR
jgi:hypothetical protein